mmetsp:Transcript_71151/g.123420  ORF Transcript_71151/g.123420 Transcript_71151/m.123420 type:complete len:90 (-) Transcript_71151:100-369(-)
MRLFALFSFFTVAAALTMRNWRGLTMGLDFNALKEEMRDKPIFQEKVADLCKGAGMDCITKTEDALFCTLLGRSSQPHYAQLHCGVGEL